MTTLPPEDHELAYIVRSRAVSDEERLSTEDRSRREQLLLLADRLEELQAVNEASYALEYDRTGGPRFDTDQPFGQPAAPLRRTGISITYSFRALRGGL
ncbi:hypothetical protein [Streptomyces vilmorinianum]|uniref:hypothetical protein n=1 Tax=Streptomyces vilmorinianum TaxID=3051092 RepID=UPI0010FB40CB|nr:hypothetical protein [Streptomyces vilmorinianum]